MSMIKKCWILIFYFLSIEVVAQKPTNIETEKVLQLHAKKFLWMELKQTDSLEHVLDDSLIYVHSNGWMQHKKDVINDLISGKLIMNKVTIKEARARMYGKTIIINGRGNFNLIVDAKPVEIELLYTEVYVKKKNEWLLASRHANRLNY